MGEELLRGYVEEGVWRGFVGMGEKMKREKNGSKENEKRRKKE